MRFCIEFYETRAGVCPVQDFLTRLEESDPKEHRALIAKLLKLQDDRHHGEPLTKPLNDGLFELRQLGKLNTRVFWFFRKGRRMILVHAIRKKGRKIPSEATRTARNRMHDWIERFGNG